MESMMLDRAMIELEKVIIHESNYLPWIPDIDAPNNYKDLLTEYHYCINGGRNFRVSSESSENTIYSSPYINYAFRAWHDRIHCENNLNFGLHDEIIVGQLQARKLDNLLATCILFADTAGQRIFYHRHKQFVQNQKLFNLTVVEEIYSRVAKYNTNHRNFWSVMQSAAWDSVYSHEFSEFA